MQFRNEVRHLMNLVDNPFTVGLEPNEVRLPTGAYIQKSAVKKLRMLCRSNSIVRKLRFKPAIAESTLVHNGLVLGKTSGVVLSVERDVTPMRTENWLRLDTDRQYDFNFEAVPNPTITQISASLVAQINAIDELDSRSVNPPFTAAIDPTDPEFVIITGNRQGQFNVYAPDHGALGVVEILQEGVQGSLGDLEVRRLFPAHISNVAGMDVAPEWKGGQNPCVIYIDTHVSGASSNSYSSTQNAIPNAYIADSLATYEFWLDKNDPAYPAYIANMQAVLGVAIDYVTPTDIILVPADLAVTVSATRVTLAVSGTATVIAASEVTFSDTATLVSASGSTFLIPKASGNAAYDKAGIVAGTYSAIVNFKINKSGNITNATVTVKGVVIP